MRDFCRRLVDEIASRGYKAEVVEPSKTGKNMYGISIDVGKFSDGNHAVPCLYVSPDCMKRPIGDLVDSMIESAVESLNVDLPGVENVMTKEGVLNHVIMCLVSQDGNESFLSSVPHKKVLDLAIVYKVLLDDSCKYLTVVKPSLMSRLGLTEEEIHKAAEKNTEKFLPVRIRTMDDAIATLFGAPDYDSSELPDGNLYVLTNKLNVNGAIALLNSEHFERISAVKRGMDLFILPSSRHEILVVPDDGSIDSESLATMVREVNDTQVEPCDLLSYSVYKYDSKSKEVRIEIRGKAA